MGIVGAKLLALSRSGLSPREIRRTCRRVADSGGKTGAMIQHLEAAAGRRAEGLPVAGCETFKPAQPPPEPEPDDATAGERSAMVAELRAFREQRQRLAS